LYVNSSARLNLLENNTQWLGKRNFVNTLGKIEELGELLAIFLPERLHVRIKTPIGGEISFAKIQSRSPHTRNGQRSTCREAGLEWRIA